MRTSPEVVSNAVILSYSHGELFITLAADIQDSGSRLNWYLPSATVNDRQTSLSSLEESLRQTIGLRDDDVTYREQLYTTEVVSKVHSTVCISYMYLSRYPRWYKGTHQVGTFSIKKLPELTSSDLTILSYALDRLHSKALYSTILQYLLPETFDLSQLQHAFETVTGQPVDRRNFRKKIASLNVITPLTSAVTLQTEPVLYRFVDSYLDFFTKPFPPPSIKAKKKY